MKVSAHSRALLLLLLGAALWLSGCQEEPEETQTLELASSPLAGTIILWHSWTPEDAAVLEAVTAQYEELNPGVEVIEVAVPRETLQELYIENTLQGTGPDVVLAPAAWLHEFASMDLVRHVNQESLAGEGFTAANEAVRALMWDERPYGWPLFVTPMALYYNRQLAPDAPETLAELAEAAGEVGATGMVPAFRDAYWGIPAFGSGLFDEQGRFTLATSGFELWLRQLANSFREPGFVIVNDRITLRERFADGVLAYYVGGPDETDALLKQMDENTLGVTTLPAGPDGPAGPLLGVEAAMLSSASSDNQMIIADSLARFLANPQQSTIFLRALGWVPAHPFVNVDPRVYPYEAGFYRQRQQANSLPAAIDPQLLESLGNAAYAAVLSGAATSAEAVCAFGRGVVAGAELPPEMVDLPAYCE